jgi:hypothetical protein
MAIGGHVNFFNAFVEGSVELTQCDKVLTTPCQIKLMRS